MHDPSLFRNKYRIKSARRPGWDYRYGSFFVTMCTRGRVPWFGHIHNEFMCLSDIGSIVADEWQRTPLIRSSVTLDAWIVIPDHVHGIIVLGDGDDDQNRIIRHNRDANQNRNNGQNRIVVPHRNAVETPCHGVSTLTRPRTLTKPPCPNPGHHTERQPGSLGAVMHQFKRACTVRIRTLHDPDFTWQARFHDHIIRNAQEWRWIRRYIRQNPRKSAEPVDRYCQRP